MKRLLALILALMICFSFLVSCNEEEQSSREEGNLDLAKNNADAFEKSTNISDKYYAQISTKNRTYLKNDFPNDYGEYYKVIKTYDELEETISNLGSISESIFDKNYVVVLMQHYENRPWSTHIGYRNARFGEKEYIVADCYLYKDRAYPEEIVEYKKISYLIIPKIEVGNYMNEGIREICVVFEEREYYNFNLVSIREDVKNDLKNGMSWIIKNKNDMENLKNKYNLDFNIDIQTDHFALALYLEEGFCDYVGFKYFYSSAENIYITLEKTSSTAEMLDEPFVYFIEIPTNVVEGELPQDFKLTLFEQENLLHRIN